MRFPSRADSTIPSPGCSCAATSGWPRCLTDDTDAPRHAFRQQLTLCRDLFVPPFASEGILELAALAAVRGAVRLVGAAAAHRYVEPEDPIEPDCAQRSSGPHAHATGPTPGTSPPANGGVLSIKDAIAYALEGPPA